MNIKNHFPENEETKYKKKSYRKGLPRSKHKHLYETVLLTMNYNTTDFKTGRPKSVPVILPTKVCNICGRIGVTDADPKYYTHEPLPRLPFEAYKKELSDEALTLPKWYADDFFDKFAHQ